jgi:hypothetical protein
MFGIGAYWSALHMLNVNSFVVNFNTGLVGAGGMFNGWSVRAVRPGS